MSQDSTGVLILPPMLVATGDPPGQSLENITTSIIANGSLCYVEEGPGQGLWQLQKESTAIPDGILIVEPISGPGRWFIKAPPGPFTPGGGTVNLVSGINDIGVAPGTGNVVVDGALLLPLDGVRPMTGPGVLLGTVNGVTLTAAGAGNLFLADDGVYTAVGGGGVVAIQVSALAATVGVNPGANSMTTYLLTFVGARTFQLPAVAADGAQIVVKEAANEASGIVVSVSGGADIDFAASYNISVLAGSNTFQFDTATNQWWVI